ncbi:hypothetical protein ACTJIL_11690 [Luteimonas sp. 22616]|uniref:hypothetical protein n=1 Tax=Luteimonas sp. 22616 TaxID=3453951 RepID=UPI003F848C40
MNTLENTCTKSPEDNIVLGVASTETQGTPISSGEPLGHDKVLGIASVETQGFAVGMDEPLGRDWPGMSDR